MARPKKTGFTPKPYTRPRVDLGDAPEHTMDGVAAGDRVRPAGWPAEYGYFTVLSVEPCGNKLRVEWDRANFVTMTATTFHLPLQRVYREP